VQEGYVIDCLRVETKASTHQGLDLQSK